MDEIMDQELQEEKLQDQTLTPAEELEQLRMREEENKIRLAQRTQYLTGGRKSSWNRSFYGSFNAPSSHDAAQETAREEAGSFPLRMLVSAAILGFFVWAHLSGSTVFGLSAQEAAEAVTQNISVENISLESLHNQF